MNSIISVLITGTRCAPPPYREPPRPRGMSPSYRTSPSPSTVTMATLATANNNSTLQLQHQHQQQHQQHQQHRSSALSLSANDTSVDETLTPLTTSPFPRQLNNDANDVLHCVATRSRRNLGHVISRLTISLFH